MGSLAGLEGSLAGAGAEAPALTIKTWPGFSLSLVKLFHFRISAMVTLYRLAMPSKVCFGATLWVLAPGVSGAAGMLTCAGSGFATGAATGFSGAGAAAPCVAGTFITWPALRPLFTLGF